jgi:hypothetical protein
MRRKRGDYKMKQFIRILFIAGFFVITSFLYGQEPESSGFELKDAIQWGLVLLGIFFGIYQFLRRKKNKTKDLKGADDLENKAEDE